MTMPMRHAGWATTLVAIGACAVNVGLAQSALPSTPCRVAGLEEQVRCATVEVPENRTVTGGRTITLRVVILPSRASENAPRQALFYVVGGPGLGATSLADLVAASHSTTRSTHDIVLVDHRGTGGSSALDCSLYGNAGDVGSYLHDQFPVDSVRACARRLALTADLARYTPADAAADLEEVRARLGISRIDIDASAYGTRVALRYLEAHSEHVRTAVLQGVIPKDETLPRTAARDAQRALDRVFADCGADPFCRTSFPGLRRELTTLLDRLDRGPLSVRVQHPRSNDSVTVAVSRGIFADRLRLMLHSTRLSRRIPIVIHRAHEGDWTPFVTLAYELSRVVFDQLDVGAHLSAACSEDLSDPVDVRGTFLKDYRLRMYREACAVWPVAGAGHSRGPMPEHTPMLLVTGELDPVTPPRFAEQLAGQVHNATVLIVPGMAHAGASRCVEEIIAAFVIRGSMKEVETSCIGNIKTPQFITR